VGARLGWDFRQQLFEGTTFTHTLIADENLEQTDDLRVDAQFGVHVAMTKGLGLKVNAQEEPRRRPAHVSSHPAPPPPRAAP
jgi:hypothetical protein